MPVRILAALFAATFLCSSPLSAQRLGRARASAAALPPASESFPLAVGNTWIYTGEGIGAEEVRVVEIVGMAEVDGVSYFRLDGYGPQQALVRLDGRGQLVEYRKELGGEALWYDFAAPEGGSWLPDRGDPCIGAATLLDRNQRTEVPAGTFSPSTRIGYGPTQCADAGIEEEIFAPGVGLLKRTEITIAGPRSLLLRQARVGGKQIQAAGLAFSLRVDRSSYTPNLFPPFDPERAIPRLQAQLTIENSGDVPLELHFFSGQKFDLTIRDAAGETVYTWSANKLFVQAAEVVTLDPGVRTFLVEVPLSGGGERPLPAGSYVVAAWLTTSGGPTFSASVGIEITEPIF